MSLFKKIIGKFSGNEPLQHTDEALVAVFMPLLSTMLLSAEDAKGSPLSREEVTEFRDKAPIIMLPVSVRDEMDKTLGRDIEPENCWYEW